MTIVGTGIELVSHITRATEEAIRNADKMYYLVVNAETELWLRSIRNDAISLKACYGVGKERCESYDEMVDIILKSVRQGYSVCAAFYGHPGVFVAPSHEAIAIAKREGFPARMLPSISAEDCLFADLGVDPARGCQSFEATEFLIFKRKFDPSCHLILWQIYVIGCSTFDPGFDPVRGLKSLVDVLMKKYPKSHPITIYEAAQFPGAKFRADMVRLAELPFQAVNRISTLYVPPYPERFRDPEEQNI